MPFHLAPLTRRSFISRTIAGGVAIMAERSLSGAGEADAELLALFSDTHIAADPKAISRNVNMADHLRTAVAEVVALQPPAQQVLIDGDCALDRGLPEDYATWLELLEPLREKGLPVHCTLGNHDAREVFWAAIKEAEAESGPVHGKYVSVLETKHANWFLLDSLDVTKQTPGRLGDDQRAWLAAALDAHRAKPALVMVHHNPSVESPTKVPGLLDAEELLALLRPRRHVKALFFGHTHTWRLTQDEGIHLVNLPPVAYPFDIKEVTGWIACQLRQDGMSLEVQATDRQHPAHGQVSRLDWRA